MPLAIASAAKTVEGILKPVTTAKRAAVRGFFIVLSACYSILYSLFLILLFAALLFATHLSAGLSDFSTIIACIHRERANTVSMQARGLSRP